MEKRQKESIISVTGNGQIETEANILEIKITIYKVTDTLKQSQEEVNKIVNDILNIMKEKNINKKNIYTASIEFYPNYTWEDDSMKYTGQRVEQKIFCIIDNLKYGLDKAVKILDAITINNNSIKVSLDFGIKETKEMVLKCRELAYQDGLAKATKYAELAGLKIIKAIKISEEDEETSYRRGREKFWYSSVGRMPTQLPTGTVEQSMSLYIDFLAE